MLGSKGQASADAPHSPVHQGQALNAGKEGKAQGRVQLKQRLQAGEARKRQGVTSGKDLGRL